MSEVANFQPQQVEQFVHAPRQMRLVEWAQEARAAHALAESLCQTPFAGAYRDNPGGATAAILKGSEVGLTPVTALGAFDLIQGQPAPKALTLRALVQAHGHSVWIESSTDSLCVAKARRRGESEVHTSTWSIARARAMDLTSKANWKKQPAAMLMARATSEVCRLVAADVILGIGYSAEEMTDEAPEPTTRVSRAKAPVMPEPGMERPALTTAKRAAPTPPPEPDLEPPTLSADEPIPPDDDTDTAPPISAKQLTALHAALGDAGMGKRAAGLGYISNLLGHDVSTTKDLSKFDASRVINALKVMVEAPFGDPNEPPPEEP